MNFITKIFNGASILALVGYILVIILGMAGYIMNIIAIVASLTGPLTTLLVIRVVGCFAFPLGAILGWF